MSYYIYHAESSRIAMGKGNKHYLEHEYPTLGAANGAMTRLRKKKLARIADLKASQYSWDHEKADRMVDELNGLKIAESQDYHDNIEQFEITYSMYDKERKNPIRQSVNTPAYMDPGCESYWSM